MNRVGFRRRRHSRRTEIQLELDRLFVAVVRIGLARRGHAPPDGAIRRLLNEPDRLKGVRDMVIRYPDRGTNFPSGQKKLTRRRIRLESVLLGVCALLAVAEFGWLDRLRHLLRIN